MFRETMKREPAKVGVVVKSLIVSYVLTAVMLLILALMVFKMNLKQEGVEIGILVIYIVSSFAGGFLAGKLGKTRKFLWGLAIGAGYIIVLLVVSLCMNHGIEGTIGGCLVRLVLCTGSGMLGGMLS